MDEDTVRDMIYAAFRNAWEEDRGSRRPRRNQVWVTELAQCGLKAWFTRALGWEPDRKTVVRMILGDSVHFLMEKWAQVGSPEEPRTREYGGIVVGGRADLLLGEGLVEFKTVAHVPKEPYAHHVNQAQLYMWLYDRSHAFIAYVSRSSGEVRVFKVVRDDERISTLLEKGVELIRAVREGRMPEPEPGDHCKFCDFKPRCPAFQGHSPQE